jgi:predicted MPP superfamily phosphohydrolase
VHEQLRLRNLPQPFEQMRIVHASDFHCSRTVSGKYLSRCIDRINSLQPDVIVLTGDYITHDHAGRFSNRVTGLLAGLKSKYGIYAALGNHDYGIGGAIRIDRNGGLDEMINKFQSAGIRVLRNEAGFLQINEHKLWFVGLGDLWSNDFEPARAFAQVDSDGPVITLAHNPESAKHIGGFNFDALFCGHTHGCRFEWTTLPDRPLLIRRRFKAGMYNLGERPLYVNRGLGRHGRIFNKRPEITVFTLC